jgi:pimeloyl-ACP methyl ester carboxylesterase
VGELLLTAGAVLAVVALAVPAAMYLLQDRLLFFPQPLSEASHSQIAARFPAVKEIFLESEDRQRIHAWHIVGAAGSPLIMYFGGNAEEVSWMIGEALRRTPGTGWLIVSHRGYGLSEGKPSEAAIKSDALRWYDHAATELRAKEIVAFGRSLGTGAAVFLASRRKVSSVILVTPFDSLVAVAKHHYPVLPVGLLLKHRFDSLQLAPNLRAPLLCIAAARDEVIPVDHARRLYEAWAGPKRWIELEGAGHNSTDDVPAFWESIEAFLQKS